MWQEALSCRVFYVDEIPLRFTSWLLLRTNVSFAWQHSLASGCVTLLSSFSFACPYYTYPQNSVSSHKFCAQRKRPQLSGLPHSRVLPCRVRMHHHAMSVLQPRTLLLTAMAARRSLASARLTAVTFTRALSSASHTNPPPSPDLTPDQVRVLKAWWQAWAAPIFLGSSSPCQNGRHDKLRQAHYL